MNIELTRNEINSLIALLGRMSRKETLDILKDNESSRDIDIIYEKLKNMIKG